MSELEKWKLVNSCQSQADLRAALETIGNVEISGGRGAYDMVERLDKVMNGSGALNLLTRNYGIRQQYAYLVNWS